MRKMESPNLMRTVSGKNVVKWEQKLPIIPYAQFLVYILPVLLIIQNYYYNYTTDITQFEIDFETMSVEDRKQELEYADEIYQSNLQKRSLIQKYSSENRSSTRAYWIKPLYPCFGEERIGGWGDGGKWLCRSKSYAGKPMIVYSIGSNGNTLFENAIWKKFGVKTFTFDPTLTPANMKRIQRARRYINFYEIGLTHEMDPNITLSMLKNHSPNAKIMRIEQITSMLGHTFIDIFKIDCEGCEIGVMRRLASQRRRDNPLFGQLLIEVHQFDLLINLNFFEALERMGYLPYHTEDNFYYRDGFELAYIHESLVNPSSLVN